MLLLTHAPEYGKNGILVMGDVAVTPVPDANQLAQIAICTAQTAKAVAGIGEIRIIGEANAVSIFNAAGQAVAVNSKDAQFFVASGIYVVVVDGKTTKVLVK